MVQCNPSPLLEIQLSSHPARGQAQGSCCVHWEDWEVLSKPGETLYLGKSDETVETTLRKMHRPVNTHLQRFAYNFKALIPWTKNSLT